MWLAAVLAAGLVVLGLWVAPRLAASTGTVVVVLSGRSATSVSNGTLMLGQSQDSWISIGQASGAVPAAPQQAQMLQASVPAGNYSFIRFRGDVEGTSVKVTQGQVEPILIGVDSGNLIPGAVYAGNDEVNLGLGELSGKFVAMPFFDLTDQSTQQFNSSTTAGRDMVVAAFHTTCHETCPIYTALFLQLAKRVTKSVILAEVTTDPDVDTPAVLADYAKRVGANWEFATGSREQVAAFWKPFGVELASGDTHTSTLALVDRHGYVRLVYRGVPDVGHDVPPPLIASMSSAGLHELASGGDGWGAPDVLDALLTIGAGSRAVGTAGGRAPDFTLTSTDGSRVRSSSLAGKALVINFWRSDCPPCKAEMPMLAQQVGQSHAQLVLVNWGESPSTARSFLAGLGIRQAALLDTDLSVGRSYGVEALPTTAFVRADGTIDRLQIGQIDSNVLASELSNLTSQ